ncbi:hypothetical protein JKP88DRAFT_324155 [Tribonema minus]|uniref:Uncharacterized protein n=1 Tax=Tribonema minus TaxID=303371 RepID=A0A835YS74_9STRA|nr:hypothetical protein JKP88DRAFT_324155 [Tribonema minus]
MADARQRALQPQQQKQQQVLCEPEYRRQHRHPIAAAPFQQMNQQQDHLDAAIESLGALSIAQQPADVEHLQNMLSHQRLHHQHDQQQQQGQLNSLGHQQHQQQQQQQHPPPVYTEEQVQGLVGELQRLREENRQLARALGEAQAHAAAMAQRAEQVQHLEEKLKAADRSQPPQLP